MQAGRDRVPVDPALFVDRTDPPRLRGSVSADCGTVTFLFQDTESGAEIMHLAENGFCADGEQERMLADGETEIAGRLPVNTDGGCLANGEPIGASGLRQIYENVLQLRGAAGKRQVPGDPRVAYSHVYGAPGVSAVTILQR